MHPNDSRYGYRSANPLELSPPPIPPCGSSHGRICMSSKSWGGRCAWRYGGPAHFFVPAFPSLHLEVQEPRGDHVRHMHDDLAGLESGRSAKAHALCCSGKLALSYSESYCIALPGTRGCKRWLPCTSRKGGLSWSALTTVTNEPFDGEETTDELYQTACSHTIGQSRHPVENRCIV